ncbi:MAG TPA: hypothetical protein VGZ90_05510 [Puia sp.]|jgi:hypothetical protein|nr:hypothetical protein [Puia sp.]
MYIITEQNIDFILEDLSKRGITIESLRLNLLDHICILIEENLEENGDFEAYYNMTIKTFYDKELYELEKETNYLLYQNNLIMKKAMIISGACSAAGFIGGSLGKIMLFRITDFLLFLGFISFVLLFLPLVFIVLIKEIKSKKDLIIYSSGTISLMLYFICMLMKCVGLPSFMRLGLENSGNAWLIMWLTGLAIGSFVFIPSYLIAGIRKPETKINSIITSILLVAFIGVQFRLTNLKQIRYSGNQHTYLKPQSKPEKTIQLASFTNK